MKDLLTGAWKGPDPLITSGRGYACVFPQDADSPVWIPDQLVRSACQSLAGEKGAVAEVDEGYTKEVCQFENQRDTEVKSETAVPDADENSLC